MTAALEQLRRDGILVVPGLGPQQLREFRAALDAHAVYGSHVAAKSPEPPVPLARALAERQWPACAPPMAATVLAPHWFEYALGYFAAAREYFDGEFPRLYSINSFWTLPQEGVLYQDTQAWHRDGDDRRQLTLFMLGTSVPEPSEGAHLYQRGTHRVPDAELGRPFREPPPLGVTEVVCGPAGTTMLVDTGGLHKAVRPATVPRLLVWARWGVSNPPASYGWDQLSPVPAAEMGGRYPADPELREAVRLVVA